MCLIFCTNLYSLYSNLCLLADKFRVVTYITQISPNSTSVSYRPSLINYTKCNVRFVKGEFHFSLSPHGNVRPCAGFFALRCFYNANLERRDEGEACPKHCIPQNIAIQITLLFCNLLLKAIGHSGIDLLFQWPGVEEILFTTWLRLTYASQFCAMLAWN